MAAVNRLAPGEHRTLPRLHAEVRPAVDEQRTPRGRVTQQARPATARVLLTPTPVLETANPARLDRLADELHAVADALRAEQRPAAATQPTLDLGAAS